MARTPNPKIEIEYRSRTKTYTVKRVVNTLEHKPGEVISESQVEYLIACRCHDITVTEGKDR